MAGHVEDRWTRPGPNGRRVRNERWGHGKRWRARFPGPDGREQKHSTSTRDEADAWLARMATADGEQLDRRAGAVAFRVYAERWRGYQHDHRESTRESVRQRLEVTVYPVLGDRPVSSIRRSDIQHLVAVASTTLAPATVRVMYAYVTAVFRSAVADRLIAASPCTSVKLPAVTRSRVVPLTTEQVHALELAVPARWRAAVTLAALSGLRPGEWRGVTIDRLTPALHLRGRVMPTSCAVRIDRQLVGRTADGRPVFGPPKSAAGDRTVTLGATATRALVEHLAEHGAGLDGLVFSTRAGWAITRTSASEVWREALERAELDLGVRSGWHQLRHYHASVLIAAGRSPRAVADRLGHEDPAETLRTYAHLMPTDEQGAIDAGERAFGAG